MRTSGLTYAERKTDSSNADRKGETTSPLGGKFKVTPKVAGRADTSASNTTIKTLQSMKRIGHLYDQVIALDNLRLADDKARKGKTRTYGVRVHDKNREANLLALHDALRNKTFHTSPYDIFTIFEPKERLIYRLPYYPDRIVHHAVMNIVEPIWVKTFTYNTYSCVKDRGIEGCAQRVGKIIRTYKGRPLFCLKIDIKKFYPSIDHSKLKEVVRRKIKDPDLLWLLDDIIDSAQGLPIGNYLSQYLANLQLCYMMHKLNEQMRVDATEYADDIVCFSDSKDRLWEVKEFLDRELEALNLRMKDNYQIFPIAENKYDKHGRGLDYVGYVFYRKQKLMRKSIKQNFCKACSKINKRKPVLELKQYKQAIAPWLGWALHSNSKNLLQTILKPQYYGSIL